MRNLSYFALFSATRITEIMAVEGSGAVQLLRDGYGDAEVQVSQVTSLAVAAMFEVCAIQRLYLRLSLAIALAHLVYKFDIAI